MSPAFVAISFASTVQVAIRNLHHSALLPTARIILGHGPIVIWIAAANALRGQPARKFSLVDRAVVIVSRLSTRSDALFGLRKVDGTVSFVPRFRAGLTARFSESRGAAADPRRGGQGFFWCRTVPV